MVGGFALAQELGRADRSCEAGLLAYQERMRELVSRARKVGPVTMSTLIPRTGLHVRLVPQLLRLLTRLPPRFQRRLFQLQATPAQALDSIRLTRSTAEG
jgi:2-polyprenyl-6-methoxyphenol hydroxylase-like FAD-dependent oxidoreductase